MTIIRPGLDDPGDNAPIPGSVPGLVEKDSLRLDVLILGPAAVGGGFLPDLPGPNGLGPGRHDIGWERLGGALTEPMSGIGRWIYRTAKIMSLSRAAGPG